MSKPTVKVIAGHCTRAGATEKEAKTWARFLHGLDWPIIKPLVQIALNSHVHPALAAGMVARSTQDEDIRATLVAHLEAKAAREDQDTPCPYCSNPEGWDACPVHRDGAPADNTSQV